jgi:hypothetical protein
MACEHNIQHACWICSSNVYTWAHDAAAAAIASEGLAITAWVVDVPGFVTYPSCLGLKRMSASVPALLAEVALLA